MRRMSASYPNLARLSPATPPPAQKITRTAALPTPPFEQDREFIPSSPGGSTSFFESNRKIHRLSNSGEFSFGRKVSFDGPHTPPSVEKKRPISTVAHPTVYDAKGKIVDTGHVQLQSSPSEQARGAKPAYGHSPLPGAVGTLHKISGTLMDGTPFQLKGFKKPAKPFDEDTPLATSGEGVQTIGHGELDDERLARLKAFTFKSEYEPSGQEKANCVFGYAAAMAEVNGEPLMELDPKQMHPFTTPDEAADMARGIRFSPQESGQKTEDDELSSSEKRDE